MRVLRGFFLFLLLVLPACMSSTCVAATTWRVPSEHPTICGSVDSAAYGDTVLVAPGTYTRERAIEADIFTTWIVMKDGVTLMSEGGAEVTELVEPCTEWLSNMVYCDSVSDAVVQGFTIRAEGCTGWGPAGIVMSSCKMTVEDNIIERCSYGIAVDGEPPRPDRPIIIGNEIDACQVGIDLSEVWSADSPRIIGNHIHHSWENGIYSLNSDPYIEGNTIEYNGWTGVSFSGYSRSLLVSNKIIFNDSHGVAALMDYTFDHPSLNGGLPEETANDVYGNGGYAVYFTEPNGIAAIDVRHNYWGTLCPDSAKFHGNINWTPWVDSTHTTVCHDCASCQPTTEPGTWGSIKAIYR